MCLIRQLICCKHPQSVCAQSSFAAGKYLVWSLWGLCSFMLCFTLAMFQYSLQSAHVNDSCWSITVHRLSPTLLSHRKKLNPIQNLKYSQCLTQIMVMCEVTNSVKKKKVYILFSECLYPVVACYILKFRLFQYYFHLLPQLLFPDMQLCGIILNSFHISDWRQHEMKFLLSDMFQYALLYDLKCFRVSCLEFIFLCRTE